MDTGALSEIQAAKGIEYLLAVLFLLLFVPLWRWSAPRGRAEAPARAPARSLASWFAVPDGIRLHPGHAWARPAADGEVLVGIDDFARAYLGTVTSVEGPLPGTAVVQGEPAWTLHGAGGPLTLTSPVSGVVLEARGEEAAPAVGRDPYGEGWLLRVRAADFARDARQLLAGSAARAWMEDAGRRLRAALAPGLGPALADGGVPVHGYAAELPEDLRREVAREFFLIEEKGR